MSTWWDKVLNYASLSDRYHTTDVPRGLTSVDTYVIDKQKNSDLTSDEIRELFERVEGMGNNWVEPGTKITKSVLLNDVMYEYEPEE